ncbi:hypothetical protein CEB3_c43710 [Peptococcaceae bacterium CEB3]|nr:hypothetical protein CEB3_c43710 [Peptococcaceae bacterium CEB3]
MAVDGLDFRRYRHEDFEEYAQVFEAVYGKAPDRDFFVWKNLKNPASAEGALIYLALNEEGKIVGANSFFPGILEYEGTSYRAVQSGDTMVLKEYRGRGIFGKILAFALADLREQDYALVYGYANGNSYPGFLKAGFADLGRIDLFYRVLSWQGILAGRGRAWRVLGGLMDWSKSILSRPAGSRGYRAESLDPASAGAVLGGKEAARRGIQPRKDAAYLEWKYLAQPHGEEREYQTLVVRKGSGDAAGRGSGDVMGKGPQDAVQKSSEDATEKSSEDVAVFVVRLDRHEHYSGGEIVESFVSRAEEAAPSVREMGCYLSRRGIDFVRIWDPGEGAFQSHLRRNGFFRRHVPLYLIVKVLQADVEFFTERERWQISAGDADTA